MTRSDPAYDYFRSDAEAQGYPTLADYFRHYGIVPPANYGRPAYKDREVTGGIDSYAIEQLHASEGRWSKDKIDKSWGEPGTTIVRINRRWSHQRIPGDAHAD